MGKAHCLAGGGDALHFRAMQQVPPWGRAKGKAGAGTSSSFLVLQALLIT